MNFILLGSMYEIGAETGRYYSINVPLREGITDDGNKILEKNELNLIFSFP